jgi:hypothetical protein
MIHIAITALTFDALAATLPLGSVAVEPKVNKRENARYGLSRMWWTSCAPCAGRGESYSDVILRLRAKEASGTIGLQRGFDANPDR